MWKVNCFVEDVGHEKFLHSLIQRFGTQYGIGTEIEFKNATGGHGRVISALKQYVRDLERGTERPSDLLIVAIDGNGDGYSIRKKEIEDAARKFQGTVICAIPEPHIERWLLLDSKAFRVVLGKGCSLPNQLKSERGYYKRLLVEAIRQAGVTPLQGGIEYTEALVNAMDLGRLERVEDSLGKLLQELRLKFQEWRRIK